MIRATLLAVCALALSGCFNWQESYNSLARADCSRIIDDGDRRACQHSVERNASEKRAEQRQRN